MRHWILILMIALLPIRSWMGDAMAVAMLATPAHAVMATVAPSHDHAAMASASVADASHTGMHHGNGMAQSDTAHNDAADSTDGDNGHTHKSCEVCNGPAMPFAVPAVPSLMPAPGMLPPPAERFASAEPHQGIKPPIS